MSFPILPCPLNLVIVVLNASDLEHSATKTCHGSKSEFAMSKSPFKDAVQIHCPCADSPADAPPVDENAGAADGDETRRIFDPTQPRAKYSLHPLGYLYFCQECQSIRCPRCVQEEIVSAFCPMCLFEVPLTSIKADGNRSGFFLSQVNSRCVRNCFQCPICFAGLSVFPNEETQAAPYTLNCMYCQWSTSEIGVEFEKPTGIAGMSSLSEEVNKRPTI
jgi:dynactin-4